MKKPGLLTENISILGYEYELLEENIVIIKNFLTDTECEYFTNLARTTSEESWKYSYKKSYDDFVERTYGDDKDKVDVPITENWYDKVIHIEKYFDGALPLNKRMMQFFDKKMQYHSSPFNIIHRQYEGVELPKHYDNFIDKGVEWAAVAYPNDDYTDGEFYFEIEEKEMSFRPPKASLLIFPSSSRYLHGVHFVGKGPERYAMPAFIHKNEEKDNEEIAN